VKKWNHHMSCFHKHCHPWLSSASEKNSRYIEYRKPTFFFRVLENFAKFARTLDISHHKPAIAYSPILMKVRSRKYFAVNQFIADWLIDWLTVWNFSPYSTIFQSYDGGQLLLVDERAQLHCTMYLGRDHRPSASKLTNFLTQSHRSEQDSVYCRRIAKKVAACKSWTTEYLNIYLLLTKINLDLLIIYKDLWNDRLRHQIWI
jgi:hypothetical protein